MLCISFPEDIFHLEKLLGFIKINIKINIVLYSSIKRLSLTLIYKTPATVKHEQVICDLSFFLFFSLAVYVSKHICYARESRLVYWLYFNVNGPLLFIE